MPNGRLCRDFFSLDALAQALLRIIFFWRPQSINGDKSGSSTQVHHVFASSDRRDTTVNIRAVSARRLPIYSAEPGSF
jgi:hypothetical protein